MKIADFYQLPFVIHQRRCRWTSLINKLGSKDMPSQFIAYAKSGR